MGVQVITSCLVHTSKFNMITHDKTGLMCIKLYPMTIHSLTFCEKICVLKIVFDSSLWDSQAIRYGIC